MDAGLGRGRRPDARVQPDPDPPPALQHPLPRRQVLPLPGAHRGGDAGPGRRCCAAPSARRCATSVPTPTPGRSATPSMRSPACSRSAPAPTRSSINGRAPKRPCLVLRHRPLRGSVRARGLGGHGGVLPGARRRHGRLPGGQSEAGAPPARSRDGRGGRAPGVRTGRQAARPVERRAPGYGIPGDGAHPARGPRHHRAGRGRPRGGVPGVHRPGRPGVGAQGLGRRSRGGTQPRRAARFDRPSALHGARRHPAPCARPRDPRRPTGLGAVAQPAPGLARAHRRAGTGRQAEAARGGHPERRRGLPPAQAAPGLGLRGSIAGPRRPLEAPRPGTGPAADRVLRHLEPGRHRQGRIHGGVRGRPAETLGLSPVPDQGSGRTGRFRFHGGDAAPPVHAPAEGAGGRPQPGATILLPTRTRGGGRRSRPAVDGVEGLGRPGLADPAHRARQAPRGGLLPRHARAAPDPARLRSVVRAAAPAR